MKPSFLIPVADPSTVLTQDKNSASDKIKANTISSSALASASAATAAAEAANTPKETVVALDPSSTADQKRIRQNKEDQDALKALQENLKAGRNGAGSAAQAKINRLKQQIQALKTRSMSGDPKAIAKEAARLAKELAAAIKELAATNGAHGGSGDVIAVSTTALMTSIPATPITPPESKKDPALVSSEAQATTAKQQADSEAKNKKEASASIAASSTQSSKKASAARIKEQRAAVGQAWIETAGAVANNPINSDLSFRREILDMRKDLENILNAQERRAKNQRGADKEAIKEEFRTYRQSLSGIDDSLNSVQIGGFASEESKIAAASVSANLAALSSLNMPTISTQV